MQLCSKFFVSYFVVVIHSCGDVMKLQIRVDESGVISDVKFKTFGCGSAIASSSYMTERVKGLSLEEAGKIKNTEIAKELCLPPVKLHCSSELLCFGSARGFVAELVLSYSVG
jgi:NifU-like protein involved in Fe-S cluster formation